MAREEENIPYIILTACKERSYETNCTLSLIRPPTVIIDRTLSEEDSLK